MNEDTRRNVNYLIRFIAFNLLGAGMIGCGSGGTSSPPVPACKADGFAMLVRSADPLAAPDHNAMPPGNQQSFVAAQGSEVGPGCTSTNLYQYMHAQWSTSDSKTVSISSDNDGTNGVATCLAATSTVTISATLTAYGFTQTLSSPSPIVCK